MKVRESFTIDEPRSSLWEFFERVDQVAACVPGVEKVEVIDDDNSRIQVTQAVGPLTSTFDLKMRITERKPEELMRFTTIGRAVKGAAGNVRATNSVSLEESEGRTRVGLEADLAMGGMLGSVGQKVIAKQATEVTKAFATTLERAVKGEATIPARIDAGGEEPAVGPVALPGTSALPAPAGPSQRQLLLIAAAAILALLLLRRLR